MHSLLESSPFMPIKFHCLEHSQSSIPLSNDSLDLIQINPQATIDKNKDVNLCKFSCLLLYSHNEIIYQLPSI